MCWPCLLRAGRRLLGCLPGLTLLRASPWAPPPCRAAKIHFLIMGHLRKQIPYFGQKKAQEKLLDNLAQVRVACSTGGLSMHVKAAAQPGAGRGQPVTVQAPHVLHTKKPLEPKDGTLRNRRQPACRRLQAPLRCALHLPAWPCCDLPLLRRSLHTCSANSTYTQVRPACRAAAPRGSR